MREQLTNGLWVPIVTPFRSDGTLDDVSLRALARHLLAQGADGIVALGTTGEPATLTAYERDRVVACCRAACDEFNRPLMVGAGTNSTAGTIAELDRLCGLAKVDAALIVAPYYTRPSPEGAVEHYHAIADASAVPLVMYNVPYRTGMNLDADALLAAGSHSNILGLKQAVGSFDLNTLQLLGAPERGFAVLAGDDAFIGPTVLLGGAGAISAAAHACTEAFVQLVRAGRRGDNTSVAWLTQHLVAVVNAGFAEPSPAVWKALLAQQGLIGTDVVRRPLLAASHSAAQTLAAHVRSFEQRYESYRAS